MRERIAKKQVGFKKNVSGYFRQKGPSLSPGADDNLHPVEHSEEPLSLCLAHHPDLVGSVETGTVCSFSNTLYHTLIKAGKMMKPNLSPPASTVNQPPRPVEVACPTSEPDSYREKSAFVQTCRKGYHLRVQACDPQVPSPLETQRSVAPPICAWPSLRVRLFRLECVTGRLRGCPLETQGTDSNLYHTINVRDFTFKTM